MGGAYSVHSVYFDQLNLDYYYDKIDGFENRNKYRIRYYQRNGTLPTDGVITLERKQKINNFIKKLRTHIDYPTAVSLLNRNALSHHALPASFDAITCERLLPTVLISYRRLAYFQKGNPRLRISFDFENNARFFHPLGKKIYPIRKHFFENEIGILEIKSYDLIPDWLQATIRRFQLNQQKVSKYCLGVDAWFDEITNFRRAQACLTI